MICRQACTPNKSAGIYKNLLIWPFVKSVQRKIADNLPYLPCPFFCLVSDAFKTSLCLTGKRIINFVIFSSEEA